MTRQEVVKWLESLKKEIGKAENRTLWHYAESIDVAIKALEDIERWRTWSHTYDNLISRQDAIDVIMGEPTDAHYPSWYADKIKSLPSADTVATFRTGQTYGKSTSIRELVEVVRCKDCRHRDLFSCPLTDNDFQKDEDYCSWGERKGGESDG